MIWRILTIFLFSVKLSFGLTFAWISDTHLEIGRERLADSERRFSLSSQLLKAAIAEINWDASVEFVVLTGDLINDGRTYNLDALLMELAQLEKPYFVVIGNNDSSSPGSGFGISKQTFFSAFPNSFLVPGRGYWSRTWRNFLLIGIDGIYPGEEEIFFTSEFLKWFKGELQKNSGKKLILFSHYPPIKLKQFFSQSIQASDKNISDFFSLLKQPSKVVGCFSGHLHQALSQRIENINFFVASALVQYPHVFYKVTVGESSIKIREKTVASDIVLKESKALLEKYFQSHPLQKALFEINSKHQLEGTHYY